MRRRNPPGPIDPTRYGILNGDIKKITHNVFILGNGEYPLELLIDYVNQQEFNLYSGVNATDALIGGRDYDFILASQGSIDLSILDTSDKGVSDLASPEIKKLKLLASTKNIPFKEMIIDEDSLERVCFSYLRGRLE